MKSNIQNEVSIICEFPANYFSLSGELQVVSSHLHLIFYNLIPGATSGIIWSGLHK